MYIYRSPVGTCHTAVAQVHLHKLVSIWLELQKKNMPEEIIFHQQMKNH